MNPVSPGRRITITRDILGGNNFSGASLGTAPPGQGTESGLYESELWFSYKS